MESVKEILENWDLPQLVTIFEENEINMEAFKYLNSDTIKELIPKVGPRTLFLKKYKEFLNSLESTAPSSWSDTGSSVSTVVSDISDIEYEVQDIPCSGNPWPDATVGLTQEEIDKMPGEKHRKEIHANSEKIVNLEKLLTNSNKGKIILSYYQHNKDLKENYRDMLANIIIENELKENFDSRISSQRFDLLANALAAVFPTECKELYFSFTFRRTNNGKLIKVGTGKLYRKYFNARREFRKSGLLPTKKMISDNVPTSMNENLDAENDEEILWLRNSVEPWAEVVNRWQNTFAKRQQLKKDLSIQDYMSLFPALKCKLGFTLLQGDFEKMYPDLEMKLFSNFSVFAKEILRYAKTLKTAEVVEFIKIFETELSEDAYSTCILFLLPMLLKPVVVKKGKGEAGTWKPSKTEISEGFILHVKIPGELKPALQRKRQKLATFGLTLQPIPIVVGESLTSITSCFVSIDDILYEIPTPLKAVGVTFMIIHALNACYAKECEQVWLLLQKGLYGLRTTYDKVYVAVEGLLKNLNLPEKFD